jgi:hypothetical protein
VDFLIHGTFMFFHLTRNVVGLSNTDLPNMPFLKNITPVLDEGLLYIESYYMYFRKYGTDGDN